MYFTNDFKERFKSELELLKLEYSEDFSMIGGRNINVSFFETAKPSVAFGLVGEKKIIQKRAIAPEELAAEIYLYLQRRDCGAPRSSPKPKIRAENYHPPVKPQSAKQTRPTDRPKRPSIILGPSGFIHVANLRMSDFVEGTMVMNCIGQLRDAGSLVVSDLEPRDQCIVEMINQKLNQLNRLIASWRY